MIGKLTGKYQTWSLNGHTRVYADLHIPYREAVELIMPVRFNALTGKGEQREITEAHARKLKSEIETGNYTPTQISAALRKSHRDVVKLNEKNRSFELDVNSDDPLAQTDGGHRMEAMLRIQKEAEAALAVATGDEKAKIKKQLDDLMKLSVGIRVYFDGNPQKDFANLQAGRTVDKAHMLSLKIQQKVLADPCFKMAFEVARHLSKQDGSPFINAIRFDSRGAAPLPISTICAKGGSDLSTSLVGIARVVAISEKDASFGAHAVITAFNALKEKAPKLLEGGKVLAPIGNGGNKGTATLMMGIGLCLTYRMTVLGHEIPSAEDLDKLVSAATMTLDREVAGNFSGPVKRSLMGQFARVFFADLAVEKHDYLPAQLLKTLSPSAFAAEAFPKAQRGRKKASVKEPDVDGTAAVAAEIQG